ncbi:MAG: hypothetical protein ABIO16_09610 [Nocardioides sp.]
MARRVRTAVAVALLAALPGLVTGLRPSSTSGGSTGDPPDVLRVNQDGCFQDGMRHCSRPDYAAYDGQGSRYVDDVRAWQTDEPALDMTAAAILAAAAVLAPEVDR